MKVYFKYPNLYLYSAFFLVTFLTQFSSIENEVIDWDESTFFVLSKYLSNGEILYIDYWDGKPPLIFLYLGIVFKIFGSSLLIGRLAGDFLIFLFSYDASQPTMTEHLGILFVVYSVYVVVREKPLINYYLLGFLFSLSFNTRNNLAFASLGIIVYLFFENEMTLRKILNTLIGFLIPVMSFGFYYFYKSSFEHYIYMLLEFPLQVSTHRMNFLELQSEIYNKLNLDKIVSVEVIVSTIFLIFSLYILKKFKFEDIPNLLKLNIIMIIFISLSIFAGGRLFNHYLIQLFPFVAIFLGYSFKYFTKKRVYLICILTITLFLNLNLSIKGYENIVNYEKISTNYPIKNISIMLNEIDLKDKVFLALENHLIYFYNEDIKSTKVVHPSNLPNTERYKLILESLTKLGLTKEGEFNSILESVPDFIFCETDCNSYISEEYFKENFILILEIDGLKLFEKKNL